MTCINESLIPASSVLTLHLHNQSDLAFDEQRVEQLVGMTLAHQKAALDDVTVSFVEETVMAGLNQKHRGRRGPTDVLSYPYDDSFPQGSGGEIVVCPDVVRANATRLGRSVEDELDTVVVHASLHLLGYTDDTEQERAKMDVLTEEILGVRHG